MPYGYVRWSVICELPVRWATAVCNSICFMIGYRVLVPVVLPSLITYKKGPVCGPALVIFYCCSFVITVVNYIQKGPVFSGPP